MGSRSNFWIGLFVVWLVILGGGVAVWMFVIPRLFPDLVPGGSGGALRVPFILWGGDIATFHANGGTKTEKDTPFHQLGLNVELVRHKDDDFDEQVKEYLSGKSPFLRGTMSMLGQASEQICKDDKTKPVVFLQMTWSDGDHLVAKPGIKTLADLKGKRIALQAKGPHVGMLKDILTTARLKWKKNPQNGQIEGDISVVWTEGVNGDAGPMKLFKEGKVDACFLITPEMEELTGRLGLDKEENEVRGKNFKGARVLVSTQHMSRSIADVYACRKDFFEKNRPLIEKFTAGYLKACEEVRKNAKNKAPEHKRLMQVAQDIYGKKDCPDEAAAEGLVEDAFLVGLPGNRAFFAQKGNLSGFDATMSAALDLAVELGDATRHHKFEQAKFDYDKIKELGDLKASATDRQQAFKAVKFLPEGTIYSFHIGFPPKGAVFDRAEFGGAFQEALVQSAKFGNAAIVVRGHTDPISVLAEFARYGKKAGTLRPADGAIRLPLNPYNHDKFDPKDEQEKIEYTDLFDKYEFRDPMGNVEILDFTKPQTPRRVVNLIRDNKDMGHAKYEEQMKKQLTKMLKLSTDRAAGARQAVIEYATEEGIKLDASQLIEPEGVGIVEPVLPLPLPGQPKDQNRRVEFRIVRVTNVARDDWDR